MSFFKKDLSVWLFFLVVILLWYFPSLTMYFAQDDFWLIKVSRVEWNEWWKLFIPASDAVWYRPLSSQFFFSAGQFLFSLNPFPLHVIILMTHAGSMFVLYKLMRLTGRSLLFGIVAALIFGLHQLHTVSVSWLATYSFVLTPFLLLLLLYFYHARSMSKMFVCFVLAALSSEVALTFPAVLFIHERAWSKSNFFKYVPYVLVVLIIVWLRWIVYPSYVSSSLYQLGLSTQLFSLGKFYLLRLLGVPLGVPLMPIEWQFVSVWLSILLALIIAAGIVRKLKSVEKEKKWIELFLLVGLWGALPFLLLPEHAAPYYLSFALIGLVPLGVYYSQYVPAKFSFINKTMWMTALISAFLILNLLGTYWTYSTHWIFQRAKLAKQLVNENKLIHPVGSEEYFSLGAGAAAEVFNK